MCEDCDDMSATNDELMYEIERITNELVSAQGVIEILQSKLDAIGDIL